MYLFRIKKHVCICWSILTFTCTNIHKRERDNLYSSVFTVSNSKVPIWEFSNSSWFIKLSYVCPVLTKSKLENTISAQHLYPMILAVCHNNVTLHSCTKTTRIVELSIFRSLGTQLVQKFIFPTCKNRVEVCAFTSKSTIDKGTWDICKDTVDWQYQTM